MQRIMKQERELAKNRIAKSNYCTHLTPRMGERQADA